MVGQPPSFRPSDPRHRPDETGAKSVGHGSEGSAAERDDAVRRESVSQRGFSDQAAPDRAPDPDAAHQWHIARNEDRGASPQQPPSFPPEDTRASAGVPRPGETSDSRPAGGSSPSPAHADGPRTMPPSIPPARSARDTWSAPGTPGQPDSSAHTSSPRAGAASVPYADTRSRPPRQSAGTWRPATPVTGPGTPAGPRQPRVRRRRRRHRWPRFLLLVLVVVLAWPAFLLWDANRNLGRTDALSTGADTPGTTYLLAGSDSRADGAVQDGTEGQRADSLMLVNVAPNGQASATSLPRDTYVDIPGYGWDKLNASYSYGGAPLLVQTVESLTGLHVDHFVEIGMGGVGNIVDAIGGVELCLDMDVNDAYSGLVWQSGCHEADGTTALAFSRMRYSDPLGDIGRAQRQRQVVEKTVSSAMSPSVLLNPVSAFRLERAGSGALTVDQGSNVIDVARLVLAFRKAGGASLTGAPPIASLGYETAAGSVVLLQDETAPGFFQKVREGTLTPSDMEQSF